jgi:hypothetical protein
MQPLLSHEIAGTRVGHMPTHELIDIWTAVSSGVVKQGFAIEYRDLEPPRTGIFDGLRIVLDPDVGFEMQCFLLLHLFGHSVQWVAPSIEHKRALLRGRCPAPLVRVRGHRRRIDHAARDSPTEAATGRSTICLLTGGLTDPPYIGHRISDIGRRTSDVGPRTSDLGPRTSASTLAYETRRSVT